MAERWLLSSHRARLGIGILALVCCSILGCGGRARVGTTDPEAKLRLERLLEAYKQYADQKGRGAPNEQAFKDFIRKLPEDQKQNLKIGDDLDSFFVSPQDGQKYVIRYNLVLNPSRADDAVAWEHTGKNGKRFVALSMGYVQEYEEAEFDTLKKK